MSAIPSISPKAIQKLNFRNKLAFSISLLSFFFLFPGIYLSMLTISTQGSVNAKVPQVQSGFLGIPSVQGSTLKHMNIKLFDTTRSILNTVRDLFNKDYFVVAGAIFLFSILIPVIKGLLLIYIFFSKNSTRRKSIFTFIKSIGKWSMCDVFIVAIFLAYLSTGATQTEHSQNVSMMGYSIHLDVLASMNAKLQIGFWCFISYCLLSLLALQIYDPY